MLLENKTILITGSSQGIGKAIAKQCIAQGANVMLHAKSEVGLTELAHSLGPSCRAIALDLAEKHSAAKLIEATIEVFGEINGLVNNAGIFPRTTLSQLTETQFDEIMTVNAKAPLLLSQQAAIKFKQQQTGGSIVNIGSINAYCGQHDLIIYSMSKGALMTLTRNLADSLAPDNIRVNQLNVGWTATETEIALKEKEGLGADWQSRVPQLYAPQGKILSPDQIAPHAVFWLSEVSAPCSGAVYEVEQYPIIGRNRISDISLTGVFYENQ